ncbi:hypothetical protein [Nocardioides lijunqiniae]|uniref:hypothetical protein n=1 Tax=Nocardioides lijunqiniae TaxID=2760832 RepID=UPI00187820CC|nr:hypothetical protein [Nocardioides lijunqiniae]
MTDSETTGTSTDGPVDTGRTGATAVPEVPRRSQAAPVSRLPQLAAGGALAATLTWVVVVVLCARRGLDLTDESFYLLSYRWWNVNFDAFTGVQYVYGPVFQLLGYDIGLLRIVRLLVTVATHAWLGWAFMGWLRVQRPSAPDTRWWEVAGAATITACAGITYSWLPLSPGYNDLALSCAFVLAGGTLRVARDNALDRPPPAWVPVGMGAAAVVMALAKWSSAALVLLGVVVVLVAVHVAARQSLVRLGRLAALGVAGVLLMAGFVQFLLVPFQTIVPPMLEVNSRVADSTNSPGALMARYRTGGETLVDDVVAQYWPLLLAAVLTPLLARWMRIGVTLAVLALGWSVVQVVRRDGTLAGSPNLLTFTVTIFAPLAAVLLAAMAAGLVSAVRERGSRQDGEGSWRPHLARAVVVVMLLVLPVAVSVGTGNLLQFMAVLGLAAWVALAIMVVTAPWARQRATQVLLVGAVGGIVLATTCIAVDGLWNRPYRTSGFSASTATVQDVPALESVRVAPDDAAAYTELRRQLMPYVERPGRAMMPFDGMAGLVYLLDGRPVGEAWYSRLDTARSTAGVIRTCDDDRWWGARKPIVLFNRPVTDLERSALRHCGIHLARYEKIRVTVPIPDVVVYVPRNGS